MDKTTPDAQAARLTQILKRLDNDWGYAHSFVRSDVEREVAALLGEIADRTFERDVARHGQRHSEAMMLAMEAQLNKTEALKDSAEARCKALEKEMEKLTQEVRELNSYLDRQGL